MPIDCEVHDEAVMAAGRLQRRVYELEAEREATWRRLAAAMGEASVGSYDQVIDLAESALKHWHRISTQSDRTI